MCGIIAYTGTKSALPVMVDGLKKLEYRGYDSAGVAIKDVRVNIVRSVGDIAALSHKLARTKLSGLVGIAHTRWATHGAPSLSNTHPHRSGRVTLVHNGVIENYTEIRSELEQKGTKFTSETDSEVIAALINQTIMTTKQPLKAIIQSLRRLQGSWALAILIEGHEQTVFGATNKSPLLVSQTSDGISLVSDIAASAEHSQTYELQSGQIVVCTPGSFEVYDTHLTRLDVSKSLLVRDISISVNHTGHDDFMHKEIYDQPGVIKRLLEHYPVSLKVQKSLVLYGCGSAYHAALAARYTLDLPHPIFVELASDSLALKTPTKVMAVAISQSGETADTLNCHEALKARGITPSCLVNNTHSRLARQSKDIYPSLAGSEISVASTKAFTAQLLALRLLFGSNRDVLLNLPSLIRQTLTLEPTIKELVASLHISPYWLVLGRDSLYPIALESALKIREITYVPCFAVPTSEMKHGTHALLGPDSTVVFLLNKGETYQKQLSSLEEICARSLNVIVLTDEAGFISSHDVRIIKIPYHNQASQQFSFAVTGQLLAYHLARKLKTNIDKPRNLAKSVTVE